MTTKESKKIKLTKGERIVWIALYIISGAMLFGIVCKASGYWGGF